MKLVFISALIAVCGAAKLDRAYLPPLSAKTAGGSPGSLQAPLPNSFNEGLRTVPKGSYTNDFQGVVVDAPAAGTKSSGESGLGAPRTYYGSINSKVGEAAFTSDLSAFRQSQAPTDNEEATSFDQRNQFEQGNQFSQRNQFGPEPRPERPQAAQERAASILRYDSEVGPESYSYSFETDNGITAEESGVATNGVQAQGGFSYTGDDGKVYTITYTADEGGYQPKGDHLPTPPPIPEEILKALEQNSRDEAAGIIDDGSYDSKKYNTQGDYAESDSNNSKYNERQSNQFGNNEESDATASGSFISQDNQPFARPSFSRQSAQTIKNENSGVSNGAITQIPGSNFGSRNEYLPPFEQNARLNSSETDLDSNQGLNIAATSRISQAQKNDQQLRPQSLSKPTADLFSTFTAQPTQNNKATQFAASSLGNNANNVGQRGQFGFNKFGSRNEYLPPFKQAPVTNNGNPSKPNANSQVSQFQARPQKTFAAQPSAFASGSFSNNGDDNHQSNQFAQNSNIQTSFQSRGQMKFNAPRPIHNINNFNFQKATSQPDIELTTPIESDATPSQHNENRPSSSEKPNVRPLQNQFGFQQNSRPSTPQVSASAFASVSSNSRKSSQPHRQNQFNQQPALLQNSASKELQLPVEIQYQTSTRRPVNQIQQHIEGQDDSYYYNQPNRAFNVPTIQNEMRNPSIPPLQFTGFRNQQKSAANPKYNLPAFQGRNPESPTVDASSPSSSVDTDASQNTSPALNGITQASASAFAQSSQFGRRPSIQQSTRRFNSQAQFQSSFSQQAQPEIKTVEPESQFAQQLENEDKFEPQPQNQESQEATSKSVFNQQYQGEVYEYTKPAETLPAPTNKTVDASKESAKLETEQTEDISHNQFVAQFVPDNEPESKTESTEESQTEKAPVPLGMAPLQDIRPSPQSSRQQVIKNQRPNSCCSLNADTVASQNVVQPSFPSLSNNQFTAQSSAFVGTQGPKLVKVSSVAGRGEIFGGPRKSPSFESESGYHY